MRPRRLEHAARGGAGSRPLCVAIRQSVSVTLRHVVGAFEGRVETSQLPKSITVDHGTEFTSTAVEAWAFYRGVELDFTRPGKPTDNGHIESFNGRLRDECLNVHQFLSLDHAKTIIEAWRRDYNDPPPTAHSAT